MITGLAYGQVPPPQEALSLETPRLNWRNVLATLVLIGAFLTLTRPAPSQARPLEQGCPPPGVLTPALEPCLDL